MEKPATSLGVAVARTGTGGAKAVYYVSSRPEAYEVFGEITYDEARHIGKLIAEHAAKAFPAIEFRIDSTWHSHQHGMEKVASYIEDHWQHWVGASRA